MRNTVALSLSDPLSRMPVKSKTEPAEVWVNQRSNMNRACRDAWDRNNVQLRSTRYLELADIALKNVKAVNQFSGAKNNAVEKIAASVPNPEAPLMLSIPPNIP